MSTLHWLVRVPQKLKGCWTKCDGWSHLILLAAVSCPAFFVSTFWNGRACCSCAVCNPHIHIQLVSSFPFHLLHLISGHNVVLTTDAISYLSSARESRKINNQPLDASTRAQQCCFTVMFYVVVAVIPCTPSEHPIITTVLVGMFTYLFLGWCSYWPIAICIKLKGLYSNLTKTDRF